MTDGTARHGTRDNGLRCAGYVPVADLDPRVADALLPVLREAGIAAYAAPTPASAGEAMESRLPPRPVDRLWVDDQQVTAAKAIVAEQTREPEPDIDTAWQQVLASLQSPSSAPVPPWPVSEDVDASAGEPADDVSGGDPAEDEHFVPPPPPPLPRLHRKTVAAIASIAVGLLVLATNFDDGSFTFLAIVAIVGGLASLVWRMHDGPPTDSGWDDGAVL